jgi:branched-chain amino acid aminotransferase
MTSTSRTEDPAITIGYLSGSWLSTDAISVTVNDLGFRQGVSVVERLRTYSGKLFAVDAHLQRWFHSTAELEMQGLPSRAELETLLSTLLAKNAATIRLQTDVGVTMFATPGLGYGSPPTFGMHLNPLDHISIERRRTQGQTIVVTEVRQPSGDCWPRTIKVRSRIHYYRADQIARRQAEDAIGVLLDDDGTVTETSIANLAIVQSGSVISPPPITVQELVDADEVLLMGTDSGIWFANQVIQLAPHHDPIAAKKPVVGPVYRQLLAAFDSCLVQP